MDAILGVLGTTALLLDDGPTDTWGKPRERAVLATLLVHAGQVVPADKLLRWVWPQDKPVPLNTSATLDTYVSRLRRALAQLPSPPSLRATAGGYRLDVDRARIDVHQFTSLVAEARAYAGRDPGRVVGLVECAFWLWRGLPLADLSSAPAQAWREDLLRNEWLAAHRIRVTALIDLGRHDEAVAALDELLTDFPDDVELTTLRLTALYGLRRHVDATRCYLSTWRRFRADGDEHAAHVLRQHHTALMATHPAPAVPRPTRSPRQLPSDVDDFVGRRAELAALDEAVAAATGVLVLEGVGGVGKTALAVHWARRQRSRFPDGQLFANLAGNAGRARVEPATVVDDFLIALGQPPDPTLTREQRALLLRTLLMDRRTLVVLDNADDTGHVQDLVDLLPSCLVIVTSRRRLSELRAENVRRVSVPAMNAEESAELLATHVPDRALDAQRLADLCGGLPLMITVLAKDLALNRPNRLMTVGTDATPGAACFASSYAALAPPERRLFRLLAVHPGPDLAPEAVYACDGRTPTATMHSLLALAETRLVDQPDEVDRVRRHDLLVEFAARCLAQDEPADSRRAALRRLLDRRVASATQAARAVCPAYEAPPGQHDDHTVPFADVAEATAWFRREQTNLIALVRHAHDERDHDHVWRLADPVAAVLDELGHHVESGMVRALAVDSAHLCGAPAAEAAALICLGRTQLALGDPDAATRSLETALGISDAATVAGPAHRLLGQAALVRGDLAAALARYDRAVTIAVEAGDHENLCWSRYRFGQALCAADRHDEALTHLEQARDLARRLGYGSAHAAALAELGAIHGALGDSATAIARCEEALAVAEGIPDLEAAALICVTLSQICAERRQFATAVNFGRRGVNILRGTQNLVTQAQVVAAFADALYGSGEPHEAALTWRRAAELCDHAGAAEHAELLRRRSERVPHPRSAPSARTSSPAADELDLPLSMTPKPGGGHLAE